MILFFSTHMYEKLTLAEKKEDFYFNFKDPIFLHTYVREINPGGKKVRFLS